MNRTVFTLVCMFITLCSFAQTSIESINFKIKDVSGELKASNNTDNYYVLEYEGKSASELYTNILSSISNLYKNPQKVLSTVENVSIKVSATALDVKVPRDESEINDVFPQKYSYWGFDYRLSFQFKDGKIKVNAPSFDADNVLHADSFTGGYYEPVAPVFPSLHFNNPSDKITIYFGKHINDIIKEILTKSETVNNW